MKDSDRWKMVWSRAILLLLVAGCARAPTGVFLDVEGDGQLDALDLSARYGGAPERRHLTAAGPTPLPTTLFVELPPTTTRVRLDVDAWFDGEVVASGSVDVAIRRQETTPARLDLSPTHWSRLILAAGRLGGSGNTDAFGEVARFDGPFGLAADAQGNVYVSDGEASTIRRIDPSGQVVTFAGSPGMCGAGDGPAADARFCAPRGLAISGSGLFVADSGNYAVRRIALDTGLVSTFAGALGEAGVADGPASMARFGRLEGLAFGDDGSLLVADTSNHLIRAITSNGVVSTLAGAAGQAGAADGPGSAARFSRPSGVVVRDGQLYVADRDNHAIRRIDLTAAGRPVFTVAGKAGQSGDDDGPLANARFRDPVGLTFLPTGELVVSDAAADTIRRLALTPPEAAVVTTLAGSPGGGDSANGASAVARFRQPAGLLATATGLWIADAGNDAIRAWSARGDVVTTPFGQPPNPGMNDGEAAKAKFAAPLGVADDGDAIYVADSGNASIRWIDLGSHWVGTPIGASGERGADDGPLAQARFSRPVAVVADEDGGEPVLWVVDAGNHNVRRVALASGVVTTIAGGGAAGFQDGAAASATFAEPWDVASDGAGNLYVADRDNDAIRRIALASGEVTTVAAARDGAPLSRPEGVALAPSGILYVANAGAHTIARVVLATGEVARFAGAEDEAGFQDGDADSARFSSPARIVLGLAGTALFVSDPGNQVVRRIAVDSGEVSTLIGVDGHKQVSVGPMPGSLNGPVGLALLRQGGLAITTAENAIVLAR